MPTERLICLSAWLLGVTMAASAMSMARAADAPAKPQRPGPDDLPSIKDLPDPFQFNDGSRVKTLGDWPKRRAELLDLIQYYEYGQLPPPAKVTAEENPTYEAPKKTGSNANIQPPAVPVKFPEGTVEQKWVLSTGPEGKIKIPVILTLPPGKGPFPVVIKGDLCWGRVNEDSINVMIARGYAFAEFDRTSVVPDKNDYTAGAYPLYPDYDFRASAAWAWGFHRVVDYLLTRPDIDGKHIAVTGHSRGGKAVLLAGATDERIALTAPNNSGCGGAGCFRYQADKSEDMARITKVFPFWFSKRLPEFVGKIDKLPIDQHSVKACVAPRALLSMEALGDLWANPEGSQVTHTAATEVFAFLNAGDKIAIHFREGKHEQNKSDFETLVDYADKVFFNKPVKTEFNKLAFPNAPKPYSWKAPSP